MLHLRPYMITAAALSACSVIALATVNGKPQQRMGFGDEVEWRSGPPITGSIKKSIDAQWFHISETCNLRAKGVDIDEK